MTLSPHIAALFEPYPGPSKPEPPPRRFEKIPHGKTLMERMLEAQGGFCGICGGHLRKGPTFDHVVPRARGGKNMYNRIIAHNNCNLRKADRKPTGCELIMLEAVNAKIAYTHVLLD